MKAFLDTRQSLHAPAQMIVAGRFADSRETPERFTCLRAGAEAAGCIFEPPRDAGLGPIAAIHTPEYLRFLETIHARWQAIPGASAQVVPNVHPTHRKGSYPSSPIGQAGYHMADTGCAMDANTWGSAYWSAQTAIAGADYVLESGKPAYALCRPPGHHAFHDMAGGSCFLNNSAIAAERMRAAGLRVAVLDVDVHHGNGTQGVFYARGDVLTVSIHADPDDFYPFFWGHAHERGAGAGLGSNLNLPLPRGSGTEVVLTALEQAFGAIAAHGTTGLVIALGLDAHEADPFRGLAVTTEGFNRIGTAIAALGLPTLYVQEGGYISDALGDALTSVLEGAQS